MKSRKNDKIPPSSFSLSFWNRPSRRLLRAGKSQSFLGTVVEERKPFVKLSSSSAQTTLPNSKYSQRTSHLKFCDVCLNIQFLAWYYSARVTACSTNNSLTLLHGRVFLSCLHKTSSFFSQTQLVRSPNSNYSQRTSHTKRERGWGNFVIFPWFHAWTRGQSSGEGYPVRASDHSYH